MKTLIILKTALKNIVSNKMRSGLTMLGLIIGIASVIILVGIGSGATNNVESQVKNLGTDILTVSIKSTTASLEYDKLNDIEELSNVAALAPYKSLSGTVSRDTTTASGTIMGVDNKYLDLTNTKIVSGRTISIIDIENRSKVCILGNDIATTLFSLAEPVGQKIKIDGDYYTVIGLLAEQGTSMGNNIDEMILIPLTTAVYLGETTDINNLYVKVEDESIIDNTISTIEEYIRQNLEISSDYYSVSSQESTISAMSDISSTLSLLLGGIASISLIVGGIGVMNVMLVSVTERTREIGIRKSLGARRIDILLQFLIEALVLSILGGILGIGMGMLIGNVLESFDFSFNPSLAITIISFMASAIIGLFFGIFPAYKAAKLNPIESLRSE